MWELLYKCCIDEIEIGGLEFGELWITIYSALMVSKDISDEGPCLRISGYVGSRGRRANLDATV